MRLRDLRDVYLHQDIYIVGTGSSARVFPFDFLRDKICIGLDHAFEQHPAIGPLAFLRSRVAEPHPNFAGIRYPIVKAGSEGDDADDGRYTVFDASTDMHRIWTHTRDTDVLYDTPGCLLHGAMQVCWILGARNVFVLGCDGDDATVGGTLVVQEFLRRKGINVFNLSNIVGYHQVDVQLDVLTGKLPLDRITDVLDVSLDDAP